MPLDGRVQKTFINHRTPSGLLEFVNGDVGEVLGFIKQAGTDAVRIKLENEAIRQLERQE